MLPTVARIFVSSTWLDLQPERQAVEEDNRCKVTLNPGEKCEIVVRFMPSSAGNRRGTLQVSVDDRLATASLSGEGVGAQPQPRRVWRCVNGKIEYLDARECQRREGESYPNEASARRGCRPVR